MRWSVPWLKATSKAGFNAKRLQTGLYDGRCIQTGNNVGETFGNKTRRRWLPNVQHKKLFSEALDRSLKLKVTTGALRTIDKCGGLDQYLLRMKPARLGLMGMRLRHQVLDAREKASKGIVEQQQPTTASPVSSQQ